MPIADNGNLREAWSNFLEHRPDLNYQDVTRHTSFGTQTIRNVLIGDKPMSPAVSAELKPLLERARRGEVMQPAASRALMITDQPAPGARRAARVVRRHDFYETATARSIFQVLDYCTKRSAIGVITANFGTGKSAAVEQWRRTAGRSTDSLVIELDQFCCGNIVEFVQTLARALDIEPRPGRQMGGRVMRDVVEKLRAESPLLIVDQSEIISVRVGQVIRQVWDRTRDHGVGVVLLGAPLLLRKLRASRAEDLGALTSRVGVWAPLAGVSQPEMAAILKQEGITEVDEPAFDLWFRSIAGSMRALMATIDLIQEKHASKRITEKTIAGIAAHLWGMQINAGGAE